MIEDPSRYVSTELGQGALINNLSPGPRVCAGVLTLEDDSIGFPKAPQQTNDCDDRFRVLA